MWFSLSKWRPHEELFFYFEEMEKIDEFSCVLAKVVLSLEEGTDRDCSSLFLTETGDDVIAQPAVARGAVLAAAELNEEEEPTHSHSSAVGTRKRYIVDGGDGIEIRSPYTLVRGIYNTHDEAPSGASFRADFFFDKRGECKRRGAIRRRKTWTRYFQRAFRVFSRYPSG